jgi:glyoxylate reductase
MMQNRVVVTQPLVDGAELRLADRGLELELLSDDGPPPADLLLDRVRGAAGIVCLLSDLIDERVLRAGAPSLRVVSNVAVGVDNVDLAAARRLGVTVCNTPGVLDAATADLAMALLLATCRRLLDGVAALRRGEWSGFSLSSSLGRDLTGMRLGLVGYGRIGRKVASRAQAFEMTVRHHARRETGVAGYVAELDELLRTSDAVSLHVPLTESTRHLLDARRIELLPRGAIVINTARGAVLEESALVDALVAGRLGGAGLDVFDDEPNVSARLLAAPNVVLTPHIGSATAETRAAMSSMAIDAVVEVLAGRPYPHVVEGTTSTRSD